jgi:AcrR family transcriptional regulator
VANAAGVSRQTLYNEFRSRLGLAQGYAHRLVDRLVDVVGIAIEANVGQVFAGLRQALGLFLMAIADDPLVQSLHAGEPPSDLLRIVTVDAHPIIEHGVARLGKVVMSNWMQAPAEEAGIFSRAVVRLALSYVSTPPEPDQDIAKDLALLLAPYGEQAIRR